MDGTKEDEMTEYIDKQELYNTEKLLDTIQMLSGKVRRPHG